MENNTTVEIIPLKGEFTDMLLMRWGKKPIRQDVVQAFKTIRHHLQETDKKIHIIVDITINPTFPLAPTFNGAIQQQSHRNMGHWLVIGSNSTARFISRTLSSINSKNIEWFDTDLEAYERLQVLLKNGNIV